jgi:hypothetical protein
MNSRSLSISLLIVAMLATIAYLYFAYQAGCAGDLKGGTLGNPHQALRYEGLSTGPMFLALLCFTASPIVAPFGGFAKRALAAGVLFLVALAALILGGIQVEIIGVQQCL